MQISSLLSQRRLGSTKQKTIMDKKKGSNYYVNENQFSGEPYRITKSI